MRRVLLVGLSTVCGGAILALAWTLLGPHSGWFGFLVVWVPMAVFALVGGPVSTRLPDALFVVRGWERGGRVYEMLGVRVAKRLLRRGPLHVFAPRMHLRPDPLRADVLEYMARMREAETSHGVSFVVAAGLVVWAAAVGWWDTAGWILLFDVIVNGYPWMLQRYNRSLMCRRFPAWTLPVRGAAGP